MLVVSPARHSTNKNPYATCIRPGLLEKDVEPAHYRYPLHDKCLAWEGGGQDNAMAKLGKSRVLACTLEVGTIVALTKGRGSIADGRAS